MLLSVTRKLVVSSALLCLAGSARMAGQQTPKKVTSASSELSGGDLFKSYCAPCHGSDAKGNGPMAVVLKVPPPNFTTLSKRNNGMFPADRVATILKSGVDVPAHGSAEMPIWGSTFADIKTHRVVTMRVSEMIRYLESIQAK